MKQIKYTLTIEEPYTQILNVDVDFPAGDKETF